MRTLLFLLCCCSISLSAQEADYRMYMNAGLAGLHFDDVVNRGAFTAAGIDKTFPLGPKTRLSAGLGLQYSNYESGQVNAPCDFPLGDKIVSFSFSETYEFNPLEAGIRLGMEQQVGRFSLRGLLLPTLRIRDRVTSNRDVIFVQSGRPNQFISTKVRPKEEFTWTDGYLRELRYSSSVQLQAALEVDFTIAKRYAIGIGYQAGLTKYELRNYSPEQRDINVPCGFASCPVRDEFEVSSVDARTGRGYVVMRVDLK